LLVRTEHGTSVALVVDQHPIGALGSDAGGEPFGMTVRPRRSRWSLDDLDVLSREHDVERAADRRVSVPDEEPDTADPIAEVHDEVACLLGGPLGRRVGGDAEDVHSSGGDLHHDQHVQPPQGAGHGRRPHPAGSEDPTDRAGADPVTKTDQLPLPATMPPAGILPGQPQDELA
jgi:hypothetical protein